MSDRLKELQRQRALLQEHLAWLDAEIARETGALPAVASLLETKGTPQATATPVSIAGQSAEDILARYNQDKPGNMAKDAKRGCLLYFIFLMCAVAIFAAGVYVLYTQTH